MTQARADREDDDPEISIAGLRDLVASADAASDGPLAGERFGRWLIVGEVATGGMAEVFLGVHKGLEDFLKVVVIKRVLPQWSSNADFVRMFVDEARLAARLEHPNIVRTYEFGEVDGQYFTTMEYLPGEDLAKTLNRLASTHQRMPIHIAAGVVSQVCAGLHFAHQLTDTAGHPLNLVHRDINPANIIVTYGGEVKLIDFGVAKTNTNVQTVAGTIKGKLAYMSPEQVLARGVDQRSDVFSTGIVLWELLAQRPLFTRDSEAATLYAIMNDPIAPPSRYRPDVPAELDAIVMRALARTPADRFDTAEEMADALEQLLMHQFAKYDARGLARVLEELFGSTRAQAKRAIAQTRSLSANISLVMKLRTDVLRSSGLIGRLDTVGSGPQPEVVEIPEKRSRLVPALAAVALVGIAVAVYVLYANDGGPAPEPVAHASLAIETLELAVATLSIDGLPPGAMVYVDGEPQQAWPIERPRGAHDIRIDVAGRTVLAQQIDVAAGIQRWTYANDKLVHE